MAAGDLSCYFAVVVLLYYRHHYYFCLHENLTVTHPGIDAADFVVVDDHVSNYYHRRNDDNLGDPLLLDHNYYEIVPLMCSTTPDKDAVCLRLDNIHLRRHLVGAEGGCCEMIGSFELL